ncbi:MAG: hypothetical protein H6760_00235 [Candidatus Nomurabacteria bacterium]|nr:MAG: hypothetical protein H6760_00235 [Candidatus Nomurabacteria bacterium]
MVMAVGAAVSLLESLIEKARQQGWLVYRHDLQWDDSVYAQIVDFIASLGSATLPTCLCIPMHEGRMLLGIPCDAEPEMICHLQYMDDMERDVLSMLLEELGLHEHAADRTSVVIQFAVDVEVTDGQTVRKEVTHRWRVADQSTWEECLSDALA